jgi:hypothetical protein
MTATERAKLLERIRHLSARTTDRGCTEAEALQAAEMMGRLLTQHGLSMTDLEIEDTRCERATVDTGRKAADETRFYCSALAEYTNTKVWLESGATKKVVFFGLPADVQVAAYLYQVIRTAFIAEKDRFNLAGQRSGQAHGAAAAHDFKVGFCVRVASRLREMAKAKRAEGQSTGRDLVLVTNAVVERQFNQLAMKMGKSGGTTVRKNDHYAQGKAAGDRVGLNPAVGNDGRAALRLGHK